MQDELIFIILILLPISFLNLILFFKVWGMTNNTKKIRAFLEAQRPDLLWNGAWQEYKEKKEGPYIVLDCDVHISPKGLEILQKVMRDKPKS